MMVSLYPTTPPAYRISWRKHIAGARKVPRALIELHLKWPPWILHLRLTPLPTVRQHDMFPPELASPYSIRKSHAEDPVQYRSTAAISLYPPSILEVRTRVVPNTH